MASTSSSKDPQARSWSPPEPLIVSPLMNFYPTYDPLLPPPTTSTLPKLPSGLRSQSSLPPALASTHVLSTHIVTAAYPRCPGPLFSPAKHEPPANEGKAERKARVEREFQEMQTLKRAAERRERGLEDRNEVLYNVFNRYKRKGEWLQDGLTLVVTHAVGFPKEVWEPTYARIVEKTEASRGVKVNEIWGFESVNHGESALVNDGKLGFIHTWAESGRDLVNFLLYYLPANPSLPSSDELPLHLDRLPEAIAQSRRTGGFIGERTLVGVGHSAGAASLFLSALWEQQLYHSLVVLEPIVMHIEANDKPVFNMWARGAIGRRARWSSREEALALYKKAPSFSYWDDEVLKAFISYGITEDTQVGGVRLKTPVILEAMAFSERQNGAHIYEMLKDLNPDIEIRFVYSGVSPESTGGEVNTRHVAYRRPVNSSNVRIGATHLMVQQSPKKVGKAITDFLQQKYRTSTGVEQEPLPAMESARL